MRSNDRKDGAIRGNVSAAWLFATLLILVLVATSAISCSNEASDVSINSSLDSTSTSTRRILLEKDKRNSEILATYYLNSTANPPVNAIEKGLLSVVDDALFIDTNVLATIDRSLAQQIIQLSSGEKLSWDDFQDAMSGAYYRLRNIPGQLSDLKDQYDWDASGTFQLRVDGVMTSATRHTYLQESAIVSAIQFYSENSDQLIYPVGTLAIGDHMEDGALIETTIMAKRADGFWDFAVYDRNGLLTNTTEPRPKALAAPTQCTGCHFGRRAFEPEKSFPADAPIGPDGPRQIHNIKTSIAPAFVGHLDEHRRRSDYVLGLYATIYIGDTTLEPSERQRLHDYVGFRPSE